MNLEKIKRITVLGTGNMGPGIALQFARAGYPVTLWGRSDRSRKNGLVNLKRDLDDLVQAGLMNGEEAGRIQRGVTATSDLSEAGNEADLVVEAIAEVLDIKQEMFGELEKICSTGTIFASSTSTLLPSLLSEKMRHKERLVVAHFWNPAYLAPLVEVCGCPFTSTEVIRATMGILKKIGNEPVLMRKEILGFIGNRIMHAMNREALALISDGVCDPVDIDRVVNSSFGPRFANLGPMEYLDFSGLDLIRNIQEYLYRDLDNTPGVLPVIHKLVEEGKLGMKSGSGLYDWSGKEDNVRKERDREFIQRLKSESHRET